MNCKACKVAPATHTVRQTPNGPLVQHAYSIGSRQYCLPCAFKRAGVIEGGTHAQ